MNNQTIETAAKEQCGNLSVDQKLEDAAGKSATETHPICMVTVDDTTFDTNHYKMIAHFHGFIAGAAWQKEQSGKQLYKLWQQSKEK